MDPDAIFKNKFLPFKFMYSKRTVSTLETVLLFGYLAGIKLFFSVRITAFFLFMFNHFCRCSAVVAFLAGFD